MPFFIGLVMGEFVVGSLWMIFGEIVGGRSSLVKVQGTSSSGPRSMVTRGASMVTEPPSQLMSVNSQPAAPASAWGDPSLSDSFAPCARPS